MDGALSRSQSFHVVERVRAHASLDIFNALLGRRVLPVKNHCTDLRVELKLWWATWNRRPICRCSGLACSLVPEICKIPARDGAKTPFKIHEFRLARMWQPVLSLISRRLRFLLACSVSNLFELVRVAKIKMVVHVKFSPLVEKYYKH